MSLKMKKIDQQISGLLVGGLCRFGDWVAYSGEDVGRAMFDMQGIHILITPNIFEIFIPS